MVSRDLCTPMLIVDRDVAAGVPGFSAAPAELPAHPYPRLARVNHPFSRIESVALLTGQTWTWRPSPFLRRRRKLWSRKYRCAQLLHELPPNNTKTTGLDFWLGRRFSLWPYKNDASRRLHREDGTTWVATPAAGGCGVATFAPVLETAGREGSLNQGNRRQEGRGSGGGRDRTGMPKKAPKKAPSSWAAWCSTAFPAV